MKDTSAFYDTLPRLASFEALTDPASYVRLPDDWVLGTADIVGSTKAIAEGKYKSVNMVGAAVISAQINTSDGQAFPYIFGGDGAAFAVPPERAETAARALASVQLWARDAFDFDLRAAMVPVATIRAAGFDVSVARHQVSEEVDYAMFSGGGVSWAEARMKAGEFAVTPAEAGNEPDLTGLSCRWAPMRARNGRIVSVVVQPVEGAGSSEFARVADAIIAIAHTLERDGHPIPIAGAGVSWPPAGLETEVQAFRGKASYAGHKAKLLMETFIAWAVLKSGIKLGDFKPAEYRQSVGRNADFRKFDDGLKMTLDCDSATLARLEEVLVDAQNRNVIDFGLFEQDEAMMTCIVPSAMKGDHVHFVDGAAGGYTQAAARMKSRL